MTAFETSLLAQLDTATETEQVPLAQWLSHAREFLTIQGISFGINLLAALLIVVLGKFLSGGLSQITRRLMLRAGTDEVLVSFAGRLVSWLVWGVALIAALEQLGVHTSSLIAILAAGGLAIGLALQNSLSNFAAGIMLIVLRPFKIGDFVDAGNVSGTVEAIHLFHTMMRTGDNVSIIVPNSSITDGKITNFSVKTERRIDLVVSCGYEDDLLSVKQFLLDLLASDPRILRDPPPLVAVENLADSGVEFVVRPWVRSLEYWDVRRDLTEQIKLGFDAHGFTIPYPTRELKLPPAVGPNSNDSPGEF